MKTYKFFLSILIIVTFFISCDLFKPGTGEKVDVNAPTISITNPDPGEFIHGTTTISGTYNEDIAVESVKISIDDGVTYNNASFGNSAWHYGINTTPFTDDQYNIKVIIKDKTGKEGQASQLVYFDNSAPLILVEFPQNYLTSEYNGNIVISGKTSDKYGISSVQWSGTGPSGKSMPIPARYLTPTTSSKRIKVTLPDGTTGIENKQAYMTRRTVTTTRSDHAWANVSGSENWSISFDSKTDIPVAGDYTFNFRATDVAGNTASYFFHFDDVKIYTGSEAITVYQLHLIDIEDPEAPTDPPITHTELDSIRKTGIGLSFDQSMDNPQFIFSSPDPAYPPEENILAGSAKAIGMVEDDDGVNISSIEVSIDGGDWVPVSETSGTGLSIRWKYNLTGLNEDTHTIQVKANDIYGTSGISASVEFMISSGAPVLDVTDPLNGDYINENFTITGTANDGGSISSVQVSFDNGTTWDDADTSNGFADWTYDVTVSTNQTLPMRIRATDNTANSTYYNLQVIVDITLPSVNFVNPANTSTVNGVVLLKGISSDNNSVTKVEIKIGKFDDWQELEDFYNWQYELDTVTYANDTHSTETPPGSQIWQLDIQARVTDIAGNEATVTTYYIKIDNDTDKPAINLISPSDLQNLAGPVLITGTAFDDDMVHHVEMQIDINGDGDFADAIDIYNGISSTKDLDTNDRFESESVWFTVEGTTLWTEEINKFGEMYETETGHDGTVIIRVRAVDTKDYGVTPDVAGNYQQITVHLDDSIPRIENLSHSSSDYVTGTFTLTGDVLDDVFVDSIWISFNGGVSYTNITADSLKVTKNQDYDYDLHVEIISTSIIPTSGILYLRVKVIDDANYQSISYINLNVDNVFPSGTWDSVNANPNDLRTTSADVQGTATDVGIVSGIEKVEVYFIRGGNVYNPATGSTAAQETNNFGDGDGSVPYTTNSACKITIDNTIEAGDDDGPNGDNDGFNESLTRAGSTYTWWSEFNSTVIPDGPITLHYVVFDNSGNGNHYAVSGLIANDKPQITGLIVGYDVDDSLAVEAGEQFTYSSQFTATNRIFIQISATDPNTPLTYEVLKNGGGLNLITSGNSCEIDISGEPEGAVYYLCRVTDGTSVYTSVNVQVDIQNTDSSPPTITINALTQSNVVAGHIELAADSLHPNPTENPPDADVSGTITVQGSAYDNRGINLITLTLSGVGTDHNVAQWSGGTLVSADGNFIINSQTFNQTGHNVTWTYTWNSATITNVAQDNINVQKEIYDFASNPGSNTLTVDVVPYTTGIVRSIGAEGTKRSKYGNFAVQEGETNLQINGYNLAKTGTNNVRVYNSGLSLYDEVTTGKVSVNGSFTIITLSDLADITHSGWLRIVVNGVEAVNNTNSNTQLYQKENDGKGLSASLWYDDRYFNVWNVGSSFGTAGQSLNAEFPSMAITSTGTLYGSWVGRANSSLYYAQPGTARTGIFNSYDPPEYSDIFIDSNNYLNIAYLANNVATAWTCNENDDLGAVAIWSNSSAPPGQTSVGYTNNYHQFEKLCHDQMLIQFQRPKVARHNNNLHVAYYDINTSSLKYGYVLSTNANENEITWINIDGGSDGDDTSPGTGLVTNGASRSASAGEYVSIEVDEGGYPVIIYYDISNQTLKLARATSLTPTAIGNWTRQTVFRTDDSNKNYVGKFVSMKFDTSGKLYATAYRTSTGDLIYITAPDADGIDYTFNYSEVIDSDGAVGSWTDISLNVTTPYISYLDNSMVGTFSGLKVAYYDSVKSSWEYVTAPLSSAINDRQTNLEYKKGSVAWTIAVGYSSTNFDIIYLKPEE